MKFIEVAVSMCILVLFLVAAGSLIVAVTDTTLKTAAVRQNLYDIQQARIELMVEAGTL